jgi:hypothetical protein
MTRSRFAAVVAAAALVLAGCGGSDEPATKKADLSDLSASKLLAKAKAAVKSEDSITISGEGKDEGSTMSLDMHYVDEDAWGTIAFDSDELRVLRVDDQAFIKAGDSFWKSMVGDEAGAILSEIDGRWVIANAASGFGEFASFADRSFLADEMLKPENTPTRGESKTVEGVECLALDDGDEGTLYLAKDDGRPIQIDDGTEGGALTFSYEDQDAPKAPAASDVVDLSRLAG